MTDKLGLVVDDLYVVMAKDQKDFKYLELVTLTANGLDRINPEFASLSHPEVISKINIGRNCSGSYKIRVEKVYVRT